MAEAKKENICHCLPWLPLPCHKLHLVPDEVVGVVGVGLSTKNVKNHKLCVLIIISDVSIVSVFLSVEKSLRFFFFLEIRRLNSNA